MNALADPLQLPLDGIRVVEASAGTGKTFTIATLYLREILERGLKVDEIVVATFTRAAAAELGERLRRRLVIADGILACDSPATARDADDGEARASRKAIARALQNGIHADELYRRVHAARLAIDTAVIGTLHGFCHRVLAEFGFETGQTLRQPEPVDDLRALETEIIRDFWRRGSADVETARLLAETWGTPEALARQACDPRWRGRAIELPEVDVASLERDLDGWRRQAAAWSDATLDQANQEIGACFSHPSGRRPRCAALLALRGWAAGTGDPEADARALREAARFDPAAMAKLGSFRRLPAGGPFDVVACLRTLLPALRAARAVEESLPAARLLRDAHGYLEAERPGRLARLNRMGHDQAVDQLAAALADPALGADATARIRRRWKAALIDEFQDTDSGQWRIAQTLFGATSLVLVGDPRQAIYGFRGGDVYAWLDASAAAEEPRLQLAKSWRAGTGMCRALNALFSRPGAFLEAGIEHPDIEAVDAAGDRALLRNGEPLPALELWWLDPDALPHVDNKLPSKRHVRGAIQQACVAWIAGALNDPLIQLCQGDGTCVPLRPRHVAVLVNSNAEAQAMQAALGRAGVAASSNLRASVYATDEAADLAVLLDAIATSEDPRRARAAHASVLIGDDAARIAAAVGDDARQAALLERVAGWATRVRRHGPLPWLHGLIQTAAPRLLALPDGQRRVANYLQLAELLQTLDARSFGLDDLATRFARARNDASADDDATRLRLDTDVDAVTVSTVHAAKGLEYEVVLVPYAVLGRQRSTNHGGRPPLCWYHRGNAARVAIGNGVDDATVERAAAEIRAEDVRKFYVAVTRARAMCVLPWGPTSSTGFSACFHLLHRAGRDEALPADAQGCRRALEELRARARDAAVIVDLPGAVSGPRTRPDASTGELHARAFTRRTLQRDWQTWSFSRLVRGRDNPSLGDPLPGSGDADAFTADAPRERGLGGARFGTAVHAAFESTDFAAWRDAARVPDSEHDLIERSLRGQGIGDASVTMAHAISTVGLCIGNALNVALPCGVRLCDVAPTQRKSEVEFHLDLQPARADDLCELLHRYGYQRQRGSFGPQTLNGLLTGKIDLTFRHAGRFHVVDWKTNRCAPYDDAALRQEIAIHDYDLQWLLYTLALHRWLRQQMADYDYGRDVGDVYYLFVRGISEGRGVHVDRPPFALIEAMDALFAAPAESRV